MNACPRLDPTVRHRTRMHVVNEVWGWERDDWSPLPIELVILNVGGARRRSLADFAPAEIIAAQIQFTEDATIVFRIVPVVSQEDAQEALRQAGYGGGGTL